MCTDRWDTTALDLLPCSPHVLQNTTMQFLVSNGDTTASDTLASILTSNPTAVLPAALWGNVSVSSLEQSQAQITVPRELLTTPEAEASDDKTPLIVGLVVGREHAAGRAEWHWGMLAPASAMHPALHASSLRPLSCAAVGGGLLLLAGVGLWFWRAWRRGAQASAVHGYEEPPVGM